MILDTFHFSFTVSDLDRSVAWYTDILGMELVHLQTQDNEYTRRLVGFSNAVLHVAQLKVRRASPGLSTHVLELVEYVSPVGHTPALPTNDVGTAHLAFIVDNAEAEYQRLRSLGVSFVNPPIEVAEGVNRGGKAAYFTDPDGITLEFMQLPPERLRALQAGQPMHTTSGRADGNEPAGDPGTAASGAP